MARRVASPRFVGREQELGTLAEALARAEAGTSTAVIVGGESGVGKSRLVAELAAGAAARGVRVLSGDCVDLGDAELPYAPVVAALRSLARDLEGAELEDVLGPSVADLAPLLPELLTAGTAPAAGALGQARLFEALLGVLRRVAERAPLVLVVEDLHWADRSTRELLAFLLRNARGERLLLIATFRTDELHRRHPLRPFLAEAERTLGVERLDVPRFTRDEIAAQLEGILDAAPEAALVDELFHRAEGNAFFTEELAAVAERDGSRRLPETVRDALMLRVEALSDTTQSVLRVAAAAGGHVGHDLLAAAAGIDDEALVAAVRQAVAHNVLLAEPGGEGYAFRHALMREAVYDDLLPGERAPLHAGLAAALEQDPSRSVSGRGVAAELAFHWYAAHELRAALHASVRAGLDAERLPAYAEANAHFERAAELWGAVADHGPVEGLSLVDVTRRAAEAAHLSADSERSVGLARRALALVDAAVDPTTAALIEERLGRYLWVRGHAAEALEAYRSAVQRLPEEPPSAERALVLGAEAHVLLLLNRMTEARPRAEQALRVARAVGAREQEGQILATLGGLMSRDADPAAGIGPLREAMEIAEELGDLEQLMRGYVNLGHVLDLSGATAEAVDVALEGFERASGHHLVLGAWLLAAEAAGRLLRLGRWDEVEALFERLAGAPLSGHPGGSLLQSRAELATLRGDLDAAERDLGEADRMLRDAIGSMWTAPVAVSRAELALRRGSPEQARAAVERELDGHGGEEDVFTMSPLLAIGARAEAEIAARARALGDGAGEQEAVARARDLAQRSERLVREGPPFVDAPLHRDVCVLEAERAAGTADPDAWQRVAGRWDELERPYAAAYCWWRAADGALAGGGGRGAAQPALRRAYATALRLAAAPLAADAESLARRARIDLTEAPPAEPPVPDADTAGLTPRELDVLRLLAAGHTNREIGELLFISEKTASVHVSRILAKLDARGRVEAAGVAHRLGLLEDTA